MRVGTFVLEHYLGGGGMSSVYSARHKGLGLSAAVKVLRAESARERGYRDLFARELHAAARLDHPSIINLYDHGAVSSDEARHLPEEFVPGAPWMAMELANSRSLRRQPLIEDFRELRPILMEVLSALAHAIAPQSTSTSRMACRSSTSSYYKRNIQVLSNGWVSITQRTHITAFDRQREEK